MFDGAVRSPDLHCRDCDKRLELLPAFVLNFPAFAEYFLDSVRIPSNTYSQTSRSSAIASNFLRNFLAQTRSSRDQCLAFVTCSFSWNFSGATNKRIRPSVITFWLPKLSTQFHARCSASGRLEQVVYDAALLRGRSIPLVFAFGKLTRPRSVR